MGGGTANKYLQQLQSPLMAFRISCLLLSFQTFRNIFFSPFSFFPFFPCLLICSRSLLSTLFFPEQLHSALQPASNVRSRSALAFLQRPCMPFLQRSAMPQMPSRSVPFASPALLLVQRRPWQRQMPRRPSGERWGRVEAGEGGGEANARMERMDRKRREKRKWMDKHRERRRGEKE